MKTSLTPQDRQFLICLARSVDGILAKQKTTDTRMIALEHNIHAAHERLNRLEANLRKPEMLVSFRALRPPFTTSDGQAKGFRYALEQLMDRYQVKRLDGVIIREDK
jgi:hypothetical protein